jgi:hypothetical protein
MSRVIWVTPNKYFALRYTGYFPSGPEPDDAKLRSGKEYLVLESEYDEKYNEVFMRVVNDEGEIWSLSNRHLRVSSVYDDGILIFSLELNKNALGFSEE